MTTPSDPALLHALTGVQLAGLRRVFYVYRGDVETRAGPLELTFSDGTTVLLDAGGDGEALTISRRAWVDPFAEPLSEVNREFVERSGKWAGFDLTPDEPLGRAIGQRLEGVDPVRDPSGKLIGIVLLLEATVIRAEVGADELLVTVA